MKKDSKPEAGPKVLKKSKPSKRAKKARKTKEEIAEIEVSAPVPKHEDGRPSLREAREIARQSVKAAEFSKERPGQVASKEPGLAYYYWNSLELSEERVARLRILFAQKGYWKCEGGEYVPGVPHAEIWCTYDEVARDLQKASAKRWEQKKRALFGGQ